jgi:hypothetical protein
MAQNTEGKEEKNPNIYHNNLETIFIFTGNLNVVFDKANIEEQYGGKGKTADEKIRKKILDIKKVCDDDGSPLIEYRTVSESINTQNHFSDGYLDKIIYAHFHVKGILSAEKLLPLYKNRSKKLPVVLTKKPFETNEELESFSPIEITIFRNGAFSIILRGEVNIGKTLDKVKYLKTIQKLEYIMTKSQILSFIKDDKNKLMDEKNELDTEKLKKLLKTQYNKIRKKNKVSSGFLVNFTYVALIVDLMPRLVP